MSSFLSSFFSSAPASTAEPKTKAEAEDILVKAEEECKACTAKIQNAKEAVAKFNDTQVGGGRRRKSGKKSTNKRRRSAKKSLFNITKKWNLFAK